MENCLNPYYTGIHLYSKKFLKPELWKIVLILIILEYIYINLGRTYYRVVSRLNPYYTGIHLHETRHPLLKAQFRLNPYYTGIHLHPRFMSRS